MEYQIGEFSRIARIPVKTLRYYHEFGVLHPVRVDRESGYRYYSEMSLERAGAIGYLKELDFSLNEIKEILKNCSDDEDVYVYLLDKTQKIREKIKKYSDIEKKIHDILDQEIKMKNEISNEDVEEKAVEDQMMAGIRFKGKYPDVGKYFGKLFRACGRHVAGVPFSLYYDDGFREDDADIEACVPVKKEISKNGVSCRVLEGGRAVSITHRGSYETLGRSYQKVTDYIREKGLSVKVPSREYYLKGPGMIFRGNPKKYVTEIRMMVEKA